MKKISRRPALRSQVKWTAAVIMSLAVSFAALGAEPGWLWQEDGWHYYLEDGSSAVGWVESEGKSYYLSQTGSMLKDTITPDGYYVDSEGAWYEKKETILDTVFTAPHRAADPEMEWTGREALAAVKNKVNQRFSGKRSLRVGENAIEFVKLQTEENGSVSDEALSRLATSAGKTASASNQNASAKATTLLGLYREREQGRYRMDIRAALDGERADMSQTASWNYEIFLAMAYQVSSRPELLAGALYSAWEEENVWGINRETWVRAGDCQVLYASGSGYGRFYIRPVQEGN